jgi:hypothetical protein
VWTKLDDGFYDNPKILACTLEAIGLHAIALSYCGRHLTGGAIHKTAPFLHGRARLIKTLVRAGLWETTKTGYCIHDWTAFNPTAREARGHRDRMLKVHVAGGKARAAGAYRTAGRFAPADASNPAGKTPPAATSPVPIPVPDPSLKTKDLLSVNGQGHEPELTQEERAENIRRVTQMAREVAGKKAMPTSVGRA